MPSSYRIRLIVLTALWLTSPAWAQEQATPTAEQLLDAHAQAMGGAAAFAKVKTSIAHGTLEIVGAGISGPLTVYSARPSSSLVVFEASELGTIRSGTDGTVAWELSDLQGPRLLEGAEKEYAIRSGLIDAPVRWRELYPKVELLGSETVDGSECWKLRLQPTEGGPETWYLDRATQLLVKATMVLDHAMGEIPVETTLSDYRRVDGILFPFRAEQKMLMQQMRTVIESIEINVEIPAELLALPPEIRALLDRHAPAPTPASSPVEQPPQQGR